MPNRDDQTIPAAQEPHSGLVLTTAFAAQPGHKPNTSIFRASERIDGVRRAESLTSSVIAYAAPTTDIAQLIKFGQLEGKHAAYTLLSSTTLPPYLGRTGNGERRLADQVRDRPGYQNVAVLISNDERTSEKFAKFSESFGIEFADKNNIKIANIARPELRDLTEQERSDYEYQFWQGQSRLYDLNSFVLYPAQSATGQNDTVAPNNANGGLNISNDAEAYELNTNGIWARAIKVDDDHFYVLPGSQFRIKANKGLHRAIVKRRKGIQKTLSLAPIPGDESRVRLMSLVNLGAPAKAAKVLTGSHRLADVWKPVPSCPFFYDADLRP